MLATLSEIVRNIVVLIILVTLLDLLLPRNHFRPYINMVVGLVLMLMLLTPFRSLLNIPATLAPALEMRLSMEESEVNKRFAVLEQINWELTLERYRMLMLEKISEILAQEELEIVEIALELEENINHPQFGQPQQIIVLAKKTQAVASRTGQVENVEIKIGRPAAERTTERVADSRMERLIGEMLGVAAEKIEVNVLSNV
ncbi:MAG: stage III sporulation protein AF [Dethiobacter sp.]|nr:stage III sporulation protein AF [Dethiobacter sp.]MBS3901963.1 stage III sporulation protein AF [Dethiobacter sp.]MBS3988969.1 stage III sporulation protein AF [Dethiobacter sp.]